MPEPGYRIGGVAKENRPMNRRQFIDVAALGIAGSAVSRTALAQLPDPPSAAPSTAMTSKMAVFVSRLRYEDISAHALEIARTAIMDTLGVSLAGGSEESARLVGRVALDEGAKKESTVYGQRFKSSALQAALVNWTAAHALDFDHSFARGGQPTAPIIPAIFALAEALGSNGRQVLEAYVAGVEVVARLIFSVTGASGAGWHANGTLGVFGASAGCGKLLGLEPSRIEMALAIAASMGSGVTANFGTMTKPLHVGLASRNGVLAARLAQSGFTANPHVLEAKNGFFDSYYQTGKPDLRVFDDLATHSALEQYGVRFKPYPCGGLTHTAIDATIRLRDEHKIAPDSVDHVDVAVPADTAEPLVYRVPKTGLEAKFSMPYLIARALTDGNVGLDAFTNEAVRSEDVRQLLQRVDVMVDVGMRAGSDGSRPASVSIRLKNGRTLTATEKFPKGSSQVPMTPEELMGKFRSCARGVIADSSSDRALRYVRTLETMRSIRTLTTLLS
jgi:2-methylcitrate dehydratase PrpD